MATPLHRSIDSAIRTAKQWESDKSLLTEIRESIPMKLLVPELVCERGAEWRSFLNGSTDAATTSSSSCSKSPYFRDDDVNYEGDDLLLKRLTLYFKKKVMKWCNQPPCGNETCSGNHDGKLMETKGVRGPTTHEERIGGASRVEVYKCTLCNTETTFPRYNSPRALFQSKRGRCGEFANLFGTYCRALGFDTRYVLDFTDHVWVEVWSARQQRWLHADSCEGLIDHPSMYEQGWGKQLSYVVGATHDSVADVTKRYTRKFFMEEFQTRRREFSLNEKRSDQVFLEMNGILRQEIMSSNNVANKGRVEELDERSKMEEKFFTTTAQSSGVWDSDHREGRISGSLAWKAARCELGDNNMSSSFGPPRPKAIATFLSSRDFLPGCQCLLHSVNTNLPPTAKNEYPPEVIVLLSSKLKDDASITDRLRLFCTRIIEVEHIPINSDDDDDAGDNKPSHVKEWDENCGWTKLHLFGLDSYDTILYIDADCLVLKDISHLLRIDDDEDGGQTTTTTTTTHANKRRGLLAAAPDIFPPDKFNAGVMVLRPSKDVFDDMISRLPQQSSDDNTKCTSYDGGDTGFLNSYYPDWYSSWPVYSRLSFGYNAQRLMYHYTYQNRPQYWDEAIDSLYIVHFSSSPKPWKAMNSSSENEESANYLDGQDKNTIQRLKGGKLEHMWLAAYERSQKFFGKEKRKQLASAQSSKLKQAQAIQPEKAPPAARSSPAQNNSKLFNKRFKELRASGMPIQEAMKKARVEYGLDKLDKIDPCQAVGQMFGLR